MKIRKMRRYCKFTWTLYIGSDVTLICVVQFMLESHHHPRKLVESLEDDSLYFIYWQHTLWSSKFFKKGIPTEQYPAHIPNIHPC